MQHSASHLLGQTPEIVPLLLDWGQLSMECPIVQCIVSCAVSYTVHAIQHVLAVLVVIV